MKISYTSDKEIGQIYIPLVNWGLLIFVIILVWGFQSSSSLAAAYGIAVTGTMVITTLMLAVLVFRVWNWPRLVGGAFIFGLLALEGLFFFSNATKLFDGGWVPIVLAAGIFVVLTTWSRGRRILGELDRSTVPLDVFIKSARRSSMCARGTAVFMTASDTGIPSALLHNLKHNQVLHERVILLTVKVERIPRVCEDARIVTKKVGSGFFRVNLHYGFADEVDIPRDLAKFEDSSGPIRPQLTSYFLGRQKLIVSKEVRSMPMWRERLFAWLLKNSESAMDYFRLPTNRVIEVGSQLRF